MGDKYLCLNDTGSYKISFNLSNFVWRIVLGWDYFSRDTIGKQFVRSVDSISANIAEGFGRYGKRGKIKFFRYSFGSAKEFLDWSEKALTRRLIKQEDYNYIFQNLNCLPRKINALIKYTNEKLTI